MSLLTGFLITRQWRDTPNGLMLRFWLCTEFGPLLIEQTAQEAVFFIENNNLEKALQLIKNQYTKAKSLELKSFSQHAVTGVYFNGQQALRRAAKRLSSSNIVALEYDIRAVDRYLMERFITGGMVVASHEARNVKNYQYVCNGKLKTCDYSPQFRIISFDIETDYKNNTLLSIAVYNKDVKSVFLLGSGQHQHCKVYQDERTLLEAFIDWVQSYDPDLLIGWNCINFDLRFLASRCQKLGVKFTLGRNNELVEWRSNSNVSSSGPKHYSILVPGRSVLDGIDTLKSATYRFENFSLDNVAKEFLGKKKLIAKVSNKAEEILRLYCEDIDAFIRYNLEDCILVWEIFEQAKLISFVIERTRLTGLPLDKVGGSVAAFENQYLPRLHRQGYVAPNLPVNPQGVGSPGGYVMDSRPGFYSNVLVLDFKSLYPSIIRSFMVDPYGLAEGDFLLGYQEEHEAGNKHVKEYDKSLFTAGKRGAYFKKESSILPSLIEKLWRARDAAKIDNNQALSQAIKIIMNSFYGVMGTPGCRFFDARLPSSITLRGHEIMLRTKDLIEIEGYQVIYGDTDSIFVWINKTISLEDANEIGAYLARKITLWWRQHLHDEHCLESALELEYETHFTRFLMPTIRGSQQGSKKRYAGMVCNADFYNADNLEQVDKASYKLIFKGLEAVRTDWTLLAREFQLELYERIFLEKEYCSLILKVVEDLRAGMCDDKLVYRKRLRRQLNEYQRNIPPHVQAAKKAEIYLSQQGKASQYEYGGWIEYCYTINGPEPLINITSPLNYELYIERQIQPIVDGIVVFLGTSFSEITGNQLSLI